MSTLHAIKQLNCVASSYPNFCVSQDICSSNVKEIGKETEGLYILLNKSIGKLGETSLKVHQVTIITEDEIKLSVHHLLQLKSIQKHNLSETHNLQHISL